MLTHISDRFAQAAVGFDAVLFDLLGQPVLQFGHLRAALGLMPFQPLLIGETLIPGLGVICVNLLEHLQDIETLIGEVRRHFDKTPTPMRQAVGQQGLKGLGDAAC